MKRLTILGSTGSIGRSTLALVEAAAPGDFAVEALVAGRDVAALAAQAGNSAPASRWSPTRAPMPRCGRRWPAPASRPRRAPEAVVEAAARPADWTMAAIVGAPGCIRRWRRWSAAARWRWRTRRRLVCAGEIVLAAAARTGATLLPVDSEHNAIFQALDTKDPALIEKIVLTASGGPFRTAGHGHDAGGARRRRR